MTRLYKIAILGFVVAIAPALAQALSCNQQVGVPNFSRSNGQGELVSDVVIVCMGGTPVAAGQTLPVQNLNLFLNTDMTSRVLTSPWTEALLLVDEPAPATQFVCPGGCTIQGTNGGNTYSGAAGRPNVFVGQLAGPNQLFFSLPFDPPGPSGQRVLRFVNVRANASALGAGASVVAFTNSALPINNATSIVSFVQNPISSLQITEAQASGGGLTSFKVKLGESSGRVFKTRTSAGPGFADQRTPGAPLDYESGFRNSAFPTTAQGNLSVAGLADTGTRVLVRLRGLFANTTVTVPTQINFGLFVGVARLVNTDSNGAGAYTPSATGLFVPDGQGVATMVYEIIESSPGAIETLEILVTLNYGPGAPPLQQVTGEVGLAPLFAVPTLTFPAFNPNGVIPFQVNVPPPPPLSISTSTPLPPGTVGNPYATTITAAGGVPPYRFFFSGNPPPGFSLSTAGVLSGVPSSAGNFNFSVQVLDSLNNPASKAFSLTIASQTSVFQLSSQQLTFIAPQGGAKPPVQSLTIQSLVPQAVNFTLVTDGGNPNTPAPNWLQVLFSSTGVPYRITVAVDQGSMPVGSYTARILIGVAGNSGQPLLIVTVTLRVLNVPPKLDVFPDMLRFSRQIANPGTASKTVQVRNAGGGGPIAFTAALVKPTPWIRGITPTQGSAGTNNPATVRVDIDTTGQPLGFQRTVIRFTWSGGKTDLPVVLFIAPGGAFMHLSRTGAYFRSNAGTPNLQTRQIRILNMDKSSAILWRATVLRGDEWLAVTPATGVSTFSDPGWVTLSVKAAAASLPVGPRYALVRVDAPNTVNAPQYIVAVLDVQAGDTTSGLDFDDGGVVLTASTGSTQALTHVFKITTGSTKPVAFAASIAATSGANIFSISPATGNVTFTAGTQFTVSANPAGLPQGVYTAEIAVAAANGVETLAVALIVSDAAGGASLSAGARAAGCASTSLAATQIGLTNSFSVPAGWPTALVVDLRDNCGTQVLDGIVVASFSNGDPPLNLTGDGISSLYSATWQPVAQVNPMAIMIHAETPSLPDVVIPLTGGIVPNPVPTLFQNGTIHNLDPKLGGPLSPGVVAQVYGSNMAGVSEPTTDVPLPTLYKGTQVLIGPYEAPLYYVSPGQLNVQVPVELPPNLPYPIVVSANGALTLPDSIDLVPAIPGVAAYGDGKVIAQHNDFAAHPPFPFVVTDADPAKRDEYLIVYLVGLGLTNPVVATGQPSPGAEPLGRPVVPTTITLGGLAVNAPFIGLTPFGVGLYQISFQVPHDAPLNTPLDLVITQNGLTANATTLTIAP